MAFPIVPLLSAIGSAIGGLFNFKKAQGEALQGAIKVLGETNASNAQREQAIATVLVAEATGGSRLAAMWRPLLMMIFAGMLVSYWFGYVPPNINGPMPPVLQEIFSILKLGIGGYIGGRSIEKIIGSLNVGSVLKKFIEKKLT